MWTLSMFKNVKTSPFYKKKYLIDVQAFQDFAFLQPSDFRFSLGIRSKDTHRHTERDRDRNTHEHTQTLSHTHTNSLTHTQTLSLSLSLSLSPLLSIYRFPVSGAQISFKESRWSGCSVCACVCLRIHHNMKIYVHTGFRFPEPK
jgi:hypothetical protein